MGNEAVSERAQTLLKALVERYIRDGQPVGSRVLAEDSHIQLSPATIRNVLADLEQVGLLQSPHTSSGRIPTAQGYRFFVDSLLNVKNINEHVRSEFQDAINPDVDQQTLLQKTSSLLSRLSNLAGVVSLPQVTRQVLRQIEFLPLSGNRVLVILVMNEKDVQNRIIYTDQHYSASALQQAANYLTQTYSGKELHTIRADLASAMHADRHSMDQVVQTSLDAGEKALDEIDADKDYVIEGKENLLDIAEHSGLVQLQSVFTAFAQKQDILHLLDQCLAADGVQIFIGDEAGYQLFDDCSIVTAPYSIDGTTVGVLGVIGPIRMAYDQVIPLVDVTAKLLGSRLKS